MTTSQHDRQPPIQELLSRIRWDPAFGQGYFELGYWDRLSRQVVRVPFEQVRTEPTDHFALRLLDATGVIRALPYHRIVALWRNGALIWQRRIPDAPWGKNRRWTR